MADATSSRPRPRPKPKAKQPLAETQATKNAARSPSVATPVADTDEMFIINRKRDNKTWQRLEKINNEAALKAEALMLSSDSGDDDTPRSRQKKRRTPGEHRPAWERNKNIKRLLSQDPSDSDSGESLMYVPDDEASPNAKGKDKGKRKRSRSRSITPPPPLSQEQIMLTKQSIRARLGVVPRPASPTLPECGDSTNDLNLAPELRAIAEKIKSQPSLPRVEGLGLDELEITVRWVPHPDNPHGKREEFGYRITKSSTFHDLFDAVADDLHVPVDRVRLLYKNHRFFPSVKPSTLNIWGDTVVFVGCDVKTYDYSRANPSFQLEEDLEDFSEELSYQPQPGFEESAPTEQSSQQQESDAEPQADDTFRIILRSNVTAGKDISVAVRSTTTCGAIVKAFLNKAGLAEQYPAAFSDQPTAPSGSKGTGGAVAQKIPQLSVDGDKLASDSEIGDADLDDGDMVDVVGL